MTVPAAMRYIIALIILLLAAAGLAAYPLLAESSDDSCGALEQRVADLASHDSSGLLVVGSLYGSTSSAPSGAAFAKDRYPLLPATVGCTIAYWKTVFDPRVPTAPNAPTIPPPGAPPGASTALAPVIARDITPNGDPISPATIFTLPMNTVAIRVDYPGGRPNAARFQLLQGRAVISSCNAEKSAPGIAWCRFTASLRKGNYSISFTADNTLLGQFPFTVIGR
jgi:hypothetical protein